MTSKPELNDFDCFLVIDPSILGTESGPFEYNLVSRRTAKHMLAGDVTPALDVSDAVDERLKSLRQIVRAETAARKIEL